MFPHLFSISLNFALPASLLDVTVQWAKSNVQLRAAEQNL